MKETEAPEEVEGKELAVFHRLRTYSSVLSAGLIAASLLRLMYLLQLAGTDISTTLTIIRVDHFLIRVAAQVHMRHRNALLEH
jgi:hypothetical protein